VETEGLRASALSQKGRGDESVAIFAEIYNRLTDELGAENSTAQWLEVERVNNLVSLQRWDEIEEIMRKRLARRIDNSELLLQMAEVIVTNGHEGYRERYLNLALEATSRALAILGENDPEATYGHAMVYFAHGDYENALSWLAKTVAFAGEDHEDIEKYREKLDEVTAVINGEQEVSKELDL
jgi:tetratricopeptide (TPR) repeat protein